MAERYADGRLKGTGGGEIMRGGAFVSSSALTTSAPAVQIYFPTAATINRVTLIGDPAGSATIDIKKTTLASLGSGPGSSICASDKPTVSSAVQADKTSFTGWTLAVGAGDVLTISLDSVSTFTRLSVFIFLS